MRSNPASDARLADSRESSQGAKGKNSSAPEMRWKIETQPGSGRRISNRSADRLRYFGRGFLAAGLDMKALKIPHHPAPTSRFPTRANETHYSLRGAASRCAKMKSNSSSRAS